MRIAHLLKVLVRRPFATTATIAMLALGIGALTAVRIVFAPLLFTPLPGVRDVDGLASVDFTTAERGGRLGVTFNEFVQLRDHATAFERMAAQEGFGEKIVAQESGLSMSAVAARVGSDYFEILGVTARSGRLFTDDESERSGLPLAVISEHLWRSLYGAAPDAIGRRLLIDDEPHTVIGVAAGFRGLFRLWPYDVWVPLSPSPSTRIGTLVGRLRRGVSAEAAAAQTSPLLRGFGEGRWLPREQPIAVVSPRLTTPSEQRYLSRLDQMYRVLILGAILLLVLSTANAANLALVRHAGERVELAVRHALGASRVRLFGELLFGTVLTGAAAAAAGLGCGLAIARVFEGASLIPGVPASAGLTADWGAIGMTVAAALGALCLAGLLPALVSSRDAAAGQLRSVDPSGPGRGGPLRNSLIAVQVATALALLATTAVLTRTVLELRWAASGFSADRVAQMRLSPPAGQSDRASTVAMYRRLVDVLRGTADVAAAAQADWPLAPSGTGTGSIALPDGTRLRGNINTVSEDYFTVLRIPLLAGRTFTGADVLSNDGRGRDVLVLSEQLARRLIPEGFPIGRRVAVRDRISMVDGKLVQVPVEVEIVGVVGDARLTDPRAEEAPMMYRPGLTSGAILIRTSDDTGRGPEFLRAAAADVAPGARVTVIGPFSELLDSRISEERLLARASIVVAAIAAVVACAGIGSVIAFILAQRRRDVALRIALGASFARACRDVSTGPLLACAAGLVGGLALFAIASRYVESRVYGIAALDPLGLTLAMVGLVGAGALAAWLPARRLSTMNLIRPLRGE